MHSEIGTSHDAVGVDIVVPIYNARDDVRLCVESVLRHATGDWRLVLVDDASTDAELAGYLDEVAAEHKRIVLLRNEVNGGFVVTANRGMREAAGRDVVLLNSDTIVTEGFVEKLVRCVYADERTGIVSPFTNNGTICSVPRFCEDNPLPADMSVDEYAAIVSDASFRKRPELVTAVGFCMYIRTEVIERIGFMDEAHFGRGFGEENDYCERAKAAGFAVRLCDDLFIAHTGKASFGEEGFALTHANSKTLHKLHPRYFSDVATFCRENPLRELQANVDYHYARHRARTYPAMMFLLHRSVFAASMGGTEHHVRDLVRCLALPRSIIVYPDDGAVFVAEVFDGRVEKPVVHRFPTGRTIELLQSENAEIERVVDEIVEVFDVGAAHIHHLLNWPVGVWRVLDRREVPFVYTAHDYHCICPNWNLLDPRSGRRCHRCAQGDADAATCLVAFYDSLGLSRPADPAGLLKVHRAAFAELLAHATKVIAPSRFVLDLVCERHENASIESHVIEHGYEARPCCSPGSQAGEPLRLALLGNVANPIKGAESYLELMERCRNMPVEWHVFGPVDEHNYGRRLAKLGLGDRLCLHGAYARERVCELLADGAIDLTLILSTWDETFCYTLSESWLAGVPAVVAEMGALPERVEASGAGVVAGDTDAVYEAIRQFAEDRERLAPIRERAVAYRHVTLQENADAHRSVYGGLIELVTRPRAGGVLGEADRRCFRAYWHLAKEGGDPAGLQQAYQRRWWYPYYQRIQPMLPALWRSRLKRAYLRIRTGLRAGSPD